MATFSSRRRLQWEEREAEISQHGSEERLRRCSSSERRTRSVSPSMTRTLTSDRIPIRRRFETEQQDVEDSVKGEIAPVRSWTPDQVLQWFTLMNASEETKEVVVLLALDGETLTTVMTDQSAHETLRVELNVLSHIQRVKMINTMKNMINDETQEVKKTSGSLKQMVGLKEVKVPKLQGSHKDMTHEKWEVYMNGVQSWAALESKDFAQWVKKLLKDPSMPMRDVLNNRSEAEVQLDQLWGGSILREADLSIQRLFKKERDRQYLGSDSGLKMASMHGRRVIIRSDSMVGTPLPQLINTKPCVAIEKLEEDLHGGCHCHTGQSQ